MMIFAKDERWTRRAAQLLELARSSTSEPEREAATREAEAIMATHGIAITTLRAFAPQGARVEACFDKVSVLVNDRPWWRAQLALVSAQTAGFAHDAPWRAEGTDLAIDLIGPRAAIEAARVVYAGLSFAIAGLYFPIAPLLPRVSRSAAIELDSAFRWGATMGCCHELALRAREPATTPSRTALVLYRPPPAPVLEPPEPRVAHPDDPPRPAQGPALPPPEQRVARMESPVITMLRRWRDSWFGFEAEAHDVGREAAAWIVPALLARRSPQEGSPGRVLPSGLSGPLYFADGPFAGQRVAIR